MCRLVIENHYTFLKGLNPNLKFLVRERNAPDYDPVIQAEFMQNRIEEVSVKGMSEEQVLGELRAFVFFLVAVSDCWRQPTYVSVYESLSAFLRFYAPVCLCLVCQCASQWHLSLCTSQ